MLEKNYLLRVKLLGIKADLYRRFIVPSTITLDRLHDVIQIVMGWQNAHLHMFLIDGKRFSDDEEAWENQEQIEDTYRLGKLVTKKGQKFKYVYDFGDDWEHEITLENNNLVYPKQVLPIEFLEGKMMCPPEDSGGAPGYEAFCAMFQNPQSEQFKEIFGDNPLPPELLDVTKVHSEIINMELRKYLIWSRDRLLEWEPDED